MSTLPLFPETTRELIMDAVDTISEIMRTSSNELTRIIAARELVRLLAGSTPEKRKSERSKGHQWQESDYPSE
jgi:hypothetical protein